MYTKLGEVKIFSCHQWQPQRFALPIFVGAKWDPTSTMARPASVKATKLKI
jgi:hypothetical protein